MRTLSDSEAREAEELSRYVGEFATLVWGIDPQSSAHPANVLAGALASVSPRQRLSGLRQAMNDTIAAAADMSCAEIARFDSMLAQRGALTISAVHRRYSGTLKKVLARGQLRNETEFYLARGALDDSAVSLTDAERAALSALIEQFEFKGGA